MEYMSPEMLIKTDLGHDNTNDWWMMGILLYHMLYGQTPFYHSSYDKTNENIENVNYKFPKNDSEITVSDEAKDLI